MAKDKNAAEQPVATYEVKEPLNFSGTVYAPGDGIELAAAQAAPLVAQGVLARALPPLDAA
jgi:hypothetical protein